MHIQFLPTCVKFVIIWFKYITVVLYIILLLIQLSQHQYWTQMLLYEKCRLPDANFLTWIFRLNVRTSSIRCPSCWQSFINFSTVSWKPLTQLSNQGFINRQMHKGYNKDKLIVYTSSHKFYVFPALFMHIREAWLCIMNIVYCNL